MIIVGLLIGLVYAIICAAFLAIPALLVCAVIYGVWRLIDDWHADFDDVAHVATYVVVIFSLIIGMLLGIPCAMVDTVEWSEPECYVTHEIINLADNNEINGRIHGRYVRGYIGEKTTYHYYFKTYDGGMELQKADAKNTIIYYTDDEPHADWYRKSRTYWWNTEYEYSCKIYIPEGTMTTEFTIDME